MIDEYAGRMMRVEVMAELALELFHLLVAIIQAGCFVEVLPDPVFVMGHTCGGKSCWFAEYPSKNTGLVSTKRGGYSLFYCPSVVLQFSEGYELCFSESAMRITKRLFELFY